MPPAAPSVTKVFSWGLYLPQGVQFELAICKLFSLPNKSIIPQNLCFFYYISTICSLFLLPSFYKKHALEKYTFLQTKRGAEQVAEQQVRSRKRVAEHGEVFTAEREVKAMCDLVKSETERIESRFLEPACGNGNFLAEVLSRKLAVVKSRYGKSPFDYERYSVLAMTSIYGVDILADNVQECRERLYLIWEREYDANVKKQADDQCRKAVRYILEKNILCGDALTMERADGSPIIFAEWSLVTGNQIKRRDFALDALLNGHAEQLTMDMMGWEYDPEVDALIPAPIREYPLTDYRRVTDYA
jgi:hypothetical protein